VSSTLIRGGPAGPDGTGGAYDNEVETDRSAWWFAIGGRQGVLKGFAHSGVAGVMALDFTAGAAMVGERAADGTASLDRGYLVWADAVARVTFDPASASARNDAVVAAFVDTEDGPLGTGVTEVGPQIVVVTGVSGTTTPRSDADINGWIGRGGWVRLLDVPIASTDTEINVAGITDHKPWAGQPHARARIAGAQSLANDVLVTADLISDSDNAAQGGFSIDTSADRIFWNGTRAIRALVNVDVSFSANGTGFREAQARHNGSVTGAYGKSVRIDATSSGVTNMPSLSKVMVLQPGQYVDAALRQNSGAALALNSSLVHAVTVDFLGYAGR
jgi:hypothetical protein